MTQTKKYYYAIVHVKSGKFLLEDGKLPIYWNRTTAKKRADRFSKFKVIRLDHSIFNIGK